MQDVPPKDYHQPIPHDQNDRSSLSLAEQEVAFFEKQITSIHNLMRGKNQLPSFDAVRRAAEEMDSTADTRYRVIPRRPDGSQDLTEAELIPLINRDSMIGVSFAENPEQSADVLNQA